MQINIKESAAEKIIAAREVLAAQDPKIAGGIDLQSKIDSEEVKVIPLSQDVLDPEIELELDTIRQDVVAEKLAQSAITKRFKTKQKAILFYEKLPDPIILSFDVADIHVIPKITYNELMSAVQWSVDFIAGGRPFVSEPIKKVVMGMAIIKYYTNIEISETELLDQYDVLMNSGVIDKVMLTIDAAQLQWYEESVIKTAANIVKYQNSAAGIIASLSDQASAEDSGLNKVIKTISENKDAFENLTPFIQAYQDLGEGKPLPEDTV